MKTTFHSCSLKSKSSSVDCNESFQATLETEEAGSILMSLSQHKPKMSISSLLDKNNSDRHEYLQKPIDLKKNRQTQPHKPRIRRCALQAYISYKTYLDLSRKKKKQQQQLALFPLRNKIVEQPLTDFLHRPVRLPPIIQRNPLQ